MWKSVLFSFPAIATASSALLLYALKHFKSRNSSAQHDNQDQNDEETSTNGNATTSTKPKQPLRHASVGERRFLDTKRWACISRPQHKYACGVASVTAVFNYLYSTLGNGDLEPVSQEQVMKILGFDEPFGEIRFGPFTGNQTLLKWFRLLTLHFKVNGKAEIFWKEHGTNKTLETIDSSNAESAIIAGLRDPNVAFIYHCYNHYMVPIGYEIDSNLPHEAMLQETPKHDDVTTWILFGDSSKTSRAIQSAKYSDISKDISLQSPNMFNIRHPEQGVTKNANAKRIGGNLHCFIIFKRDANVRTPKLKTKKKKSVKKRLHDAVDPDTTTLSNSSQFAVSAVPRKEVTVEILLTKKQKSAASAELNTEAEVFEKKVEATLQQQQQEQEKQQ